MSEFIYRYLTSHSILSQLCCGGILSLDEIGVPGENTGMLHMSNTHDNKKLIKY